MFLLTSSILNRLWDGISHCPSSSFNGMGCLPCNPINYTHPISSEHSFGAKGSNARHLQKNDIENINLLYWVSSSDCVNDQPPPLRHCDVSPDQSIVLLKVAAREGERATKNTNKPHLLADIGNFMQQSTDCKLIVDSWSDYDLLVSIDYKLSSLSIEGLSYFHHHDESDIKLSSTLWLGYDAQSYALFLSDRHWEVTSEETDIGSDRMKERPEQFPLGWSDHLYQAEIQFNIDIVYSWDLSMFSAEKRNWFAGTEKVPSDNGNSAPEIFKPESVDICRAMHRLLLEDESLHKPRNDNVLANGNPMNQLLFTVASDGPYRNDPYSLLYWLDYCIYEVGVAHQQGFHLGRDADLIYLSPSLSSKDSKEERLILPSYCTVKYYSLPNSLKLDPRGACEIYKNHQCIRSQTNHSTNELEKSSYCLEDVYEVMHGRLIDFMVQQNVNTANANADDSALRNHFHSLPRQWNYMLSTSLDQSFAQYRYDRHRYQRDSVAFHELVSVLRSFANFRIRRSEKGIYNEKINDRLRIRQLSSKDLIAFNDAVHQFGEGSMHGQNITSIPTTSALRWLNDLLNAKQVEIPVQADSIYVNVNKEGDMSSNKDQLGNPQPDDISVSSNGEAYFFVFVIPEHTEIAQYLTQRWVRECSIATCHIFVRPIVIPIQSSITDNEVSFQTIKSFEEWLSIDCTNPDEGTDSWICKTEDEIVKNFLSMRPSYRSVILELDKLSKELLNRYDLVTISIGLEGLFAVPMPSQNISFVPDSSNPNEVQEILTTCDVRSQLSERDTNTKWRVVPLAPYSQSSQYCLTHWMMIGTKPNYVESTLSASDSQYEHYNFNNIVGIAKELAKLIELTRALIPLLHAPASFNGSDRIRDDELWTLAMSIVIDTMQKKSTNWVTLDRHRNAFETRWSNHFMKQLHQYLVKKLKPRGLIGKTRKVDNFEVVCVDYCNYGKAIGEDVVTRLLDTFTSFSNPSLAMSSTTSSSYIPWRGYDFDSLFSFLHQDSSEGVPLFYSLSATSRDEFASKHEILSRLPLPSFFEDADIRFWRYNKSQVIDESQSFHPSKKCQSSFEICKDSFNYVATNYSQSTYLSSVLGIVRIIEDSQHCHFFVENVIDNMEKRLFQFGSYAVYSVFATPMVDYQITLSLFEWLLYTKLPRELHDTELMLQSLPVANRDRQYQNLIIYRQFISKTFTAIRVAYSQLASFGTSLWDMKACFYSSLMVPSTYQRVARERNEWLKSRSELLATITTENGVKKRLSALHVVTFASHSTPEFEQLMTSAIIAGVPLKVIGMGKEYTHYGDKIKGYFEYLHGDDSPVADNDVVVFVDAFDVLIFPPIRRTREFLAQSHTPIVFCAEQGVYPEFPSAFAYLRGGHELTYALSSTSGLSTSYDYQTTRFINSGVIIGRGKEMKEMIAHVYYYRNTIRDDQQLFYRYYLSLPHRISIDTEQRHTFTTYKALDAVNAFAMTTNMDLLYGHRLVNKDEIDVLVYHWTPLIAAEEAKPEGLTGNNPIQKQLYQMKLLLQQLHTIGIVHANNRRSNLLYTLFTHMMQRFRSSFFAGKHDKGLLLQAMWFAQDGEYDKAWKLLHHPKVLANSTIGASNVEGKNYYAAVLSDYLVTRRLVADANEHL